MQNIRENNQRITKNDKHEEMQSTGIRAKAGISVSQAMQAKKFLTLK